MANIVRAIYRQGRLELLNPVDLEDETEVWVSVLTEVEVLRLQLGDMVASWPTGEKPDPDEPEEIPFSSLYPLSQTIIDERHGP
jgi:predicted DNA-binding antitoxin AbrB/MazE fold protein